MRAQLWKGEFVEREEERLSARIRGTPMFKGHTAKEGGGVARGERASPGPCAVQSAGKGQCQGLRGQESPGRRDLPSGAGSV